MEEENKIKMGEYYRITKHDPQKRVPIKDSIIKIVDFNTKTGFFTYEIIDGENGLNSKGDFNFSKDSIMASDYLEEIINNNTLTPEEQYLKSLIDKSKKLSNI